MKYSLKLLSIITLSLTISLTASQQLIPNSSLISEVLAQAPNAEDRIKDGVYLNQNGRDDFEKGRPQEAIEKYQQALTIFREVKARAGEANSLSNIGEVYHYSLGKYQEALTFYQQALAIRQEIGDKEGEWASLNYIADANVALGQYQQAVELYQQALVIIRQLGDRTSERLRLNQIAGVYFRIGDYPKALEYYQQALPIHKQADDKEGVGTTLSNIGVTYVNLGQYAQALQTYQQALNIFKEIPAYQGSIGTILNNIGGVYFTLGQNEKALDYTQQALAVFNKFSQREYGDTTLTDLGLLYDSIGKNPRILEFNQQQLAIRREIVGTAFDRNAAGFRGEAATYTNLGQIYFNQGQSEQAIKLHQQSLTLYKKIGDRVGEAIALNNLGQVYNSQQNYPKALDFYQQALTIYKEVGDKTGVGIVLSNIGQTYNNSGDYPKALDFYQQALTIHREVKDKAAESITLNNIGTALLASGNFTEATNKLTNAIDVLESLRPGLSDTDKVSIFEKQAITYSSLQQALISQNKIEAALEIAERGRARAFVELLAQRLSTKQTSDAKIPSLKVEQIKQIAKSHNATLVEYSIINETIKVENQAQNHASAIFIWVIKPTGEVEFRRSDLKTILQQQDTSLENLIFSSRDSIGVRGLPIVAIRPRAATKTKKQTNSTEQLKQLHQLLIQPIAEILPKDPNSRIIFMPQRELFLVPFPALQDATGKYLIEQHTILTSPAIQVLDLTRQQRQRTSGKNILVVGNPTMPSVSPAPGETPQQLPSLPGAEIEAKGIAQLLNTKAITGNEATKIAIKQQMSGAKIIHLATHGLLENFGDGVPGAIALAPSGNDNGLLTSSEILNLKLSAELVVLSACDTGRGKITGDGVIGLSRSLITAGAPSVIVSLWSVPDAPTASLMTEFYRQLQQKPDRAEALRQAILTTMKQYPSPKDWAAFTLIGEAE